MYTCVLPQTSLLTEASCFCPPSLSCSVVGTMAFEPAVVTLLPSFFDGVSAPIEEEPEVVEVPRVFFAGLPSGKLKALLRNRVPGQVSKTMALRCVAFTELPRATRVEAFAAANIFTYRHA